MLPMKLCVQRSFWLRTLFFALSNRMANMISMRPNDDFYLLGRTPRPVSDKR